MLQAERREVAKMRHKEIVEQQETYKRNLANMREEKKKLQKEQERERQKEIDDERRRHDWLVLLMLQWGNSVMRNRYAEKMAALKEWEARRSAAGCIQNYWIRTFSMKR